MPQPTPAPESSEAPDRDAALRRAIVQTLAYADLFDWPLTAAELQRYLPIEADPEEVTRLVDAPASGWRLRDGLVTLAGREALAEVRHRRAAASRRLWPGAIRAARAVGAMPFVRMVAITGSLAVGAAETAADVDLFVVTTDGRLWLSRAATIGIGRVAGLAGLRLCPNYLLAESALELGERDRFTAHELGQMVPIVGGATYRKLLAGNAWYRAYLPNHRAAARRDGRLGVARRVAEGVLGTRPFDALERWEMRRKIERLSAGATSGEQRFDATVCKGHFDEHRRQVLDRYAARLVELGIGPPP